MFNSAGSVERLVNWLGRLPGIGRKSATRLAFHILKLPAEEALELADIIREVKEKVKFCSVCYNISEADPCHTCTDPNRRQDTICVVEEAMDAAAMDKVDGFDGLFHVLGGRLHLWTVSVPMISGSRRFSAGCRKMSGKSLSLPTQMSKGKRLQRTYQDSLNRWASK